jgi:hypothetical protein
MDAIAQRHLQGLERHIEGFGDPGVQRMEGYGALAVALRPCDVAGEAFERQRGFHRVGAGRRPCIGVGHGLALPAYTLGPPLLQSMPPG